MRTPLVIYHSPCQDGFTAAWAIWLKHPDWDFYPAKHGDPPPDLTGREIIYMVDFSYKRPVILEMATPERSIIILDHHKTAEADLIDLPSNVSVTFDMNKSGARLAWEAFHEGEFPPDIVRIVEDRDLWKFKIEFTKEVSSTLFSLSYEFEKWSEFSARLHTLPGLEKIVSEGSAILRKQAKDTEELLKNKFKMVFAGSEVWACNLPYTFSSDAGNILAQGEKFGLTFYLDGEYIVWSLRSDENGRDVSEVAKMYGGGGHKHAAGCRTLFCLEEKIRGSKL